MKTQAQLEREFFNVRMPRWYWWSAVAFRSLCTIAIVSALAWNVTTKREDPTVAMVIIVVAALCMILPSIPKAVIEQRNRIRGLRDGTLMAVCDAKRDSQQATPGDVQ